MREVLNFVIDVVPIIISIAYFHILVSAIIKSTLQFKTTFCNFQQKKKRHTIKILDVPKNISVLMILTPGSLHTAAAGQKAAGKL